MHIFCHAGDIPEGEARGFGPNDGVPDRIFVVRRHGCFYAYRDACPHYGGTPMAWRKDAYLDAAGAHIVCASHGALFHIESGMCVSGAALGMSLCLISIHIRPNGDIAIA